MYATENLTKPAETLAMSDGGLLTAEQVADSILDSIVGRWRFLVTPGMDSFLLGTLTTGFAPHGAFARSLVEVALMSLIRFVSAFYHVWFDRIIARNHATRVQQHHARVLAAGKGAPRASARAELAALAVARPPPRA